MTTQKGIAARLGVSQAVVSKVLSGNTTRVSMDTAEQILEAARRMNYSKRKQSQSRFIGVLLSQAETETRGYSYGLRLLAGVQEQARKLNAIPIQHILNAGDVDEAFFKDVSGWIALVSLPPEKLRQLNRPLVFLHCGERSPGFDLVIEDTWMGVRLALKRLAALGHRRFGYFNVRPWGVGQAANYGAFHQVLAEFNLPPPLPEWIFTPSRREATMADVERQTHEFLAALRGMKERPSALFIAGDVYALPFLRMAPAYGFAVPGDFSVFGYDDIPESALCAPSLSSIAQPLEELGREAVSRLMARLDAPGMESRTICVPMAFNERASVGPAIN